MAFRIRNGDEDEMAETATIHMPAAQSHRGAADAVPRVGSDALVSPGLLERLMHTALEHAAAQRGVLVVLRERAPWIEAEARAAEGGMEVTARSAPLGAVIFRCPCSLKCCEHVSLWCSMALRWSSSTPAMPMRARTARHR